MSVGDSFEDLIGSVMSEFRNIFCRRIAGFTDRLGLGELI